MKHIVAPSSENSGTFPRRRLPRAIATAAKAGISLGLLTLVLRSVDPAPVLDLLLGANGWWAGIATVTIIMQLAVNGLRWHYVGTILGIQLGARDAVRLMFIGHFFSQALPTGFGGDAIRAWLLGDSGVGLRRAVSTVLCDRVIAMGVLIAMICAMIPFLSARIGEHPAVLSLSLIFGVLLVGSTAFVALGPAMLDHLVRFQLGRLMQETMLDLRKALFGSPISALVLALSLAAHAGMVYSCFAIGRAVGAPVDFVDCLIMIPPVMFATVIPVSIAGWGVREGAMVAGLGLLGVPAEAALALSIAIGVLQLVVSIPGAVFWAWPTRDL